jgi:hypothetical protein
MYYFDTLVPIWESHSGLPTLADSTSRSSQSQFRNDDAREHQRASGEAARAQTLLEKMSGQD